MQVKRFVAQNMRLALKMVREEAGLDAVILSNKRVAEGVEILIAMDPEGHLTSSLVSSTPSLSDNPFKPEQDTKTNTAARQQPAPSKLELELERMQRDAQERARLLAASLNVSQRPTAPLKSAVRETDAPVERQDFKQLLAGVNELTSEQSVATATPAELPMSSDSSAIAAPPEEVAPEQAILTEAAPEDGELAQMRSELQVMRDMMERQLSSMAWGQYREKSPGQASSWRRLKRVGLDAALCRRLLNEVNTDADYRAGWQQIMAQLSEWVPVAGRDLLADGGVFTFVGPTGAGKTTTIGKLAAQYVLKNGSENIALVSTDTARIGAYEQLRTFARILGVPVKIVDAQNSLEKVLFGLRDKSLVLVDTSGYNRQDPRLARQMSTINKLGSRLTSLLVLPTTSQGQVLKAAYHSYKTDNLGYCILSKLDESSSLGEAISLSVENALPIAYSTDGQDVPEDIALASGQGLVARAIALAQQIEIDDTAMVDDFAAARS